MTAAARFSLFRRRRLRPTLGALVLAAAVAGTVAAQLADEPAGGEPAEGSRPMTGVLDVDRSVTRVLKQADDFASAGRHAEALVLWQKVLDDPGGGLVTSADLSLTTFGGEQYQRYQPIGHEVERRLAALPAGVLSLYRRDVDGAAQAALRESRNRGTAPQGAVVRRYLLSAAGESAAEMLACYHLDRGEFVQAGRLLERIREVRPSSLEQEQFVARLAIAEAGLGDVPSARQRLAALERRAGRHGPSETLRRALRFLALAGDAVDDPRGQNPNTSSARMSVPPLRAAAALPSQSHVARLTEVWSRSVAPSIKQSAGPAAPGSDRGRITGTVLSISDDSRFPRLEPSPLVERWTDSDWTPAGEALFHGGLAIFKGAERLIAVSAASGEVRWMGLRNRFDLTWSSQAFGQAGANAAARVRPSTPEEIQRFGDRIHHSLSLSDGTVYSLEGPLVDFDSHAALAVGAPEASRAIVRRSLSNRLAAYDAATGKLKWQCDPGENLDAANQERGFLSAPIAIRGRLLAPVSHEGELWLYAIEPAGGSVQWRVFLCDEPAGGCSPWAPVALAGDGSELYLATGAGVIFAVDSTSGRVEWAVAYRRNGIREMQVTRPGAGFVVRPESDGWRRDALLVHGPQLIVTPSDYGHLIALDRRDGRLRWHSPRQPSGDDSPAHECLGIAAGGLFVAGRNVVRRYDLPSGRLVWQTATANSHGRGLLTADALYVPVESEMLRLDLATGSELSRSELVTPAREPVGNLYSDGERLLCLSGERLYALDGLEPHFNRLAARIEAGDAQARLERMRLHVRLAQLDEAVADLRAACGLVAEQQGLRASDRLLFAGIAELDLAATRPQLAIELIAATAVPRHDGAAAADAASDDADVAWQRSQLLHTAFRQFADGQEADGESDPRDAALVPAILGAAPLCQAPFLQLAARRAMVAAARADDRDSLRAAAGAEDPATRLLAVAGIAAALADDALPPLRAALDDHDESVRFEAAVAMTNRGHRDALAVFAALLESEDLHIRNRSLATLRAVTGENLGYIASADPAERARKAAEWRTWLDEQGPAAELRLPIRETGLLLGRTLISYTNNRVVELDEQGRIVWQQEVANPWGCQGLSNGHRLVASYSDRAVFEYDAEGRLVWKKTNLPSAPYSVERLEGGRTLVACYSANKLLEIAADGSLFHETTLPDHPRDATRLDNGHTLVALYMSQRVAEVDPQGRIVWEVGDMHRPIAVQRLDNGHTLVCQYFGKQVVEIDRAGTVVWFKSGLEYPYDAQRLPTGNTLIVDRTGVQEVDPTGMVVWQQPGSGATSVCRY